LTITKIKAATRRRALLSLVIFGSFFASRGQLLSSVSGSQSSFTPASENLMIQFRTRRISRDRAQSKPHPPIFARPVEAAATIEDFEPAFAAMVQQRAGGLIVATDPFLLGRRDQLVALAARHGIPTIYQFREFSISEGLLSYGTNINGAYRKAGEYVGWILSGEKQVHDLPIFQQTTLELVINMKAAKALGLNIPASLVVFADELIE
jgi:hypothetical protein